MIFIFCVLIALVIAIAGLLAPHDLISVAAFGTSFVAWFAGLAVISIAALWAHSQRERLASRFDMLGASEIVVVYGIFGLLASLAFGSAQSAPLIAAGLNGEAIDLRGLLPLAARFTEGLLAAGIAPLIAVLLRQYELMVGKPRLVDVVLDPKELEREFKGLELSLKGLNREVETMMMRFGGSADRLAEAVVALNGALNRSAAQVDLSGQELGAALSRGAASIGPPLEATSNRLGEMDAAVRSLREALTQVAPNMDELTKQGKDAAKVLDELVEIIGSVRNFIDRSRS